MFGSGVFRGLGVTLKQFVGTYLDDIKQIPSRYAGGKEVIDQTAVGEQEGLFTIQYPEERRLLPERFRYIPMLLYETNAETGAKEDRCTACGICAKVCPPQCIWIVRDKDENGKPITRPSEFYIDTTVCMNCGLCAEFCPFDAIKMNHDFEITAYKRMPHLVFDLEELSVPVSYYARIRPTDYADEEAARKAKEAEKAARPVEKVERVAKPAPATAAPAAEAPAAAAAAAAVADASAPAKRTPEEIERLKAEAAARRAAKAVEGPEAAPAPAVETPTAAAPASDAPTGVGAKRSPEEIERLKAEAAARRAAKAGAPAGETPLVEAAPAAPAPEAVAPIAPAEPPAPTGVGAKRSPEEIERLKAEAAARRAAKAAQQGAPEGGEEQK
jgi:NADH-quinone oxidoreductase subunit I